jgi:hypothetical protein
MILYGDVLICSLQPRAIGFCSAVRARLQGAFTCEGVLILSNELTVAEAEEYCRYAFRERKKSKDSGIPHVTNHSD